MKKYGKSPVEEALPKVTVADVLRGRKLFRPKLPELPQQCVSCPFREGNDREFQAVVVDLAIAADLQTRDLSKIRESVREEVSEHGDFACHGSAYLNGERRDNSEHRQCPGATEWFKTHVPARVLP